MRTESKNNLPPASYSRPALGSTVAIYPAKQKPQRFSEWLLYRLCEALWHFFSALLRRLSPQGFRLVAVPVLKILILVAVPRRRILQVLDSALGHTYARATKKGMARGVQHQYTASVVDCLLHMQEPQRLVRRVRVQGVEHLEAARAKGKGVIALGSHMGNFLLVGGFLKLKGYSIHSLFRFFPDDRIMDLVHRDSQCFFSSLIPSLPRRDAVKRILTTLKRNEIVLILADNYKRGEVQTKLFGQPIRSARGPVSLALRSGAPVLPVYLIRDHDGSLLLVIEPELDLIRSGRLNSDVTENTHLIAQHLEGLIRRYPDQWHWLTVRMKGKGKPGRRGTKKIA